MKSNLIITSIVLCISVSFMSCKKDTPMKDNSFVYNNQNYETTHGYIQDEPILGNTSLHYVYLCSSGLTLQNGGGISGSGDYLMLSFSSNSPDNLISGDYSFPVTFYAYFWLGYDPTTGVNSQFGLDAASSSAAIVKVDGNTYEINYSIGAPGGKTVKGNYKGTLEKITGFH
jgi:hypothetical protein